MTKKTTFDVFKDGSINKDLLSKVKRVEKLKPKAVEALCRKIVKEGKEADFPYKEFLPAGIENKRKIFRHVARLIKDKTYKYLELPVHHNYAWNSEAVLDVVVDATIRHSCIEDASNSLNLREPRKIMDDIEVESVPNGDTVLRRIQKLTTYEWTKRLEKANNDLLKPIVKARVLNKPVWLALDITPVPFYGDKRTPGAMGTKRVKGTNYAFKYMTVCITAQRERLTLAGSYMTQLMNHQKLMKELLLKSLKYIKGRLKLLCDREFCTVPYIKILEELNAYYLMAIARNSRINKIIKETKEFPRVVKYPMGRGKDKVEFWLILVKNEKGKVHSFATNIEVDEKNCEQLVELYRNRWTIETSYRMTHAVRARTCSKNFAFRWFLVLFGLLVRNGYYLYNEIIIHYGHVTLKTFAELTSEARLITKMKIAADNSIFPGRNGNGG